MTLSRRMAWQAHLVSRAPAPDASMRAAPPAAGVARARPRVLMICGLFGLPYRALRCAAATGAQVHVLGNHGARGFRYSRYCASFTLLQRPLDGSCDAALAETIDDHVRRLDIDIVMAGDQPAARSLAGLRPLLRARCFPMPDLATFDLLNNKWEFTRLCQRLGIPCPPTVVLADRHALAGAIASGALSRPLIAKPLALDGSRGVVPLRGADVAADLAEIRYAPVLVQNFIAGVDIGASAFCERGEVRAFVVHRLARAAYATFPDARILDSVRRIVGETRYSGVCNFDMRLTPEGEVLFLECNPRFFYKMDLSMLAGVNFAAYGLDTALPDCLHSATRVRLPKAFLATLPTPWRLTRRDLRMLVHRCCDPISHVREVLRIDWEDRSY